MVFYGTQCWTIRKSDDSRVWIFERKILKIGYTDPAVIRKPENCVKALRGTM